MQFNAQFFERTTECHRLGDIILLPYLANTKITGADLRVMTEMSMNLPCKPTKLQMRLRSQEKGISDIESLMCIPTVYTAGFGYVILSEGLTHKTCNAFKLWRLQGVSQLGRLHDPLIAQDSHVFAYGQLYEHNRLVHSLNAAVILRLIAHNNHLSQFLTRHAHVLGLSHDGRTPVFSDALKSIDASFFDEDANYHTMLQGEEWEELSKEYELDRSLLIEGVLGHGLLGSLLDIADKISYLAGDIHAFTRRYSPELPLSFPRGYKEVAELLSKRRSMMSIWSSVRVRGEQAYVDNAAWLAQVLTLRAMMFKHLYLNSDSRYWERLTSVIMVEALLELGKLTKDDLLVLTDEEVDRMIIDELNLDATPVVMGMLSDFVPEVRVCHTTEEAKRAETEMLREGIPITSIDSHPSAKPGTRILTRKGRKIMPFAEACPEESQIVDGILKDIPTVKLFYVPRRYEELPYHMKLVSDSIRRRMFGGDAASMFPMHGSHT